MTGGALRQEVMGNMILRQIQMFIPLKQTVERYSAVSGIAV